MLEQLTFNGVFENLLQGFGACPMSEPRASRCLISPRWVLKSELVIIQSFALKAARGACVEL
jgi:hypothetical protein